MKKLGEHDQRFDRLEMAVMQNTLQIKELKVGQDKLQASQDKLQANQDKLQADVEGLKAGQKRIEQKLDTAIDNHEKRISKLEEKVNI